MSADRMLLLLNPKQRSLDHIPGGYNQIGWEDVAAALGMGNLDPLAYYLGRTKYCQDERAKQTLLNLMTQYAQFLAESNKWRTSTERLIRLCHLACQELIESPICKKCRGTGKVLNITCQYCNSEGYVRKSERSKYLFVGIDKRCWARRWKERYERLYSKVCDAEHRLIKHLSKQLFDNEEEKKSANC